MTTTPTLAIDELRVEFAAEGGRVAAVRGVSLEVGPAQCVGIVGESGSGKTQLFMAAMGLLPRGAGVSGRVRFEGEDLIGASRAELNRVRGSKLTMVFQDPMTSLTPHLTVGVQLAETLVTHRQLSWSSATAEALRMLERVRITEAARRLGQYPHQLSGGMRQRVMIGMALLCEPTLLIADEPTTALDVTVQAGIIDLLRTVRLHSRMALVLVSHDLGVVASLAERLIVMYAGRIVESAACAELLRDVRHPYTAALLACVPTLHGARTERMQSIPGTAPDPRVEPPGCAFAPRCSRAGEICRVERPPLREVSAGHQAACHFPVSA